MPRYYPIYVSLSGKTCLVVGGGSVGERKTRGLLEAGAKVRIVSLAWTPELQTLAATRTIEALEEPYHAAHLEGITFAFAATDNRAVNAQVAADATEKGIPVNVADAPEDSDFITPSVVRRGDLCISISTGGNQPLLAAHICDELESRFGAEYGEFMELLGRMRDYTKQGTTSPALRRSALLRLIEQEKELRTLLREGDRNTAYQRAEALINAALAE